MTVESIAKYISYAILSLICVCLVSACSSLGPHYTCTYKGKKFNTYSIYRPYVGHCTYKGGYWNDWSRWDNLRYEVKNTYPGFEITYYKKYNHPADFEFKIVAKTSKSRDGQWFVYDGEIHIKKEYESEMRRHYKKDISGVQALKDVWVFPATIKRSYGKLPEEKYIYPQLPTEMMYVYNVFYNGVGRGFGINGQWVGADQYDNW